MREQFAAAMDMVGTGIDLVGVAVIALGALAATVYFVFHAPSLGMAKAYTDYRVSLGRAILLGLEFLVAGDIIRTVAVSPTLMSIAVLAGIVVIRTVLSFALQLEVEGRWPWQGVGKTGA